MRNALPDARRRAAPNFYGFFQVTRADLTELADRPILFCGLGLGVLRLIIDRTLFWTKCWIIVPDSKIVFGSRGPNGLASVKLNTKLVSRDGGIQAVPSCSYLVSIGSSLSHTIRTEPESRALLSQDPVMSKLPDLLDPLDSLTFLFPITRRYSLVPTGFPKGGSRFAHAQRPFAASAHG